MEEKMNNLKGETGRAILEQIRSARRPNLKSVKKEADECIARILAKNNQLYTNCPFQIQQHLLPYSQNTDIFFLWFPEIYIHF